MLQWKQESYKYRGSSVNLKPSALSFEMKESVFHKQEEAVFMFFY